MTLLIYWDPLVCQGFPFNEKRWVGPPSPSFFWHRAAIDGTWVATSDGWWNAALVKDQMLLWIHFDERLMIVKTIWQKQALTLQLHGALYLGIKIIEATTTFCFVLQIFQVWFLCKGQLNYIQSAFFCHLFPMVLLSCKLLLQRNLQTFDEKARQILPHDLLKNFLKRFF